MFQFQDLKECIPNIENETYIFIDLLSNRDRVVPKSIVMRFNMNSKLSKFICICTGELGFSLKGIQSTNCNDSYFDDVKETYRVFSIKNEKFNELKIDNEMYDRNSTLTMCETHRASHNDQLCLGRHYSYFEIFHLYERQKSQEISQGDVIGYIERNISSFNPYVAKNEGMIHTINDTGIIIEMN